MNAPRPTPTESISVTSAAAARIELLLRILSAVIILLNTANNVQPLFPQWPVLSNSLFGLSIALGGVALLWLFLTRRFGEAALWIVACLLLFAWLSRFSTVDLPPPGPGPDQTMTPDFAISQTLVPATPTPFAPGPSQTESCQTCSNTSAPTETATPRLSSSAVACANRDILIERHTTYIVQPNDSLWCIARRAGVPIDELEQANPELATHPTLIHPGDPVTVP